MPKISEVLRGQARNPWELKGRLQKRPLNSVLKTSSNSSVGELGNFSDATPLGQVPVAQFCCVEGEITVNYNYSSL